MLTERGLEPREAFAFGMILLLGIASRTWHFGSMPPGLSPDEVSTGVDAFSLLHFGMDRNGSTFPVHFISWGSGQNALYAYLLIPFIAVFGLTPEVVRLPMLLTGIMTLPLVFLVGRHMAGTRFGLIAMFLVAVSPWHVMLSRWGLESNVLPFVFLAAVACAMAARRENRRLVWMGLLLGLSAYAYGSAYVAAPLFLALAVALLARRDRIKRGVLISAIGVTILTALPIMAFVAVNTFKLPAARVGPVSIPRLPSVPRFETLGAVFGAAPFRLMWENIRATGGILIVQTDNLPWNVVEPYGYFYRCTFPIAALGALMLAFVGRKEPGRTARLLIVCWLAAGGTAGLLQPANINRLNILYIPLIVAFAFAVHVAAQRWRPMLPLSAAAFLIAFAMFNRDYHGAHHQARMALAFDDGILPALKSARQIAGDERDICVTGEADMGYVSALFVEKADPRSYLDKTEYVNPRSSFRVVKRMGRYSFGFPNCPYRPGTVYVVGSEVVLPRELLRGAVKFGQFRVVAARE